MGKLNNNEEFTPKIVKNEEKNQEMQTSKSDEVKRPQDFEFISNDPEENADNFDPKWELQRKLSTDEERYQAIRTRWGNSNIPDPCTNLSHRNRGRDSSLPLKEINETKCDGARRTARDMNRRRPFRRSRSCTRPYERLINNLENNYFAEYCQLMLRQKHELQEMLQNQSLQQMFNMTYCFDDSFNFKKIMKINQEKEIIHLLTNHYHQINVLMGKKTENIDACKRYMEEVKAFFAFYQKINENEVTLQMSDEQYEHTVETDKMYSLYNAFYR